MDLGALAGRPSLSGWSRNSWYSRFKSCPPSTGRRPYRARVEEALRLWIVHVRSHSRHRQNVVTVMTLARVSMIVPLQNGHDVGRVTSPEYESFMYVSFLERVSAFWPHAGASLTLSAVQD